MSTPPLRTSADEGPMTAAAFTNLADEYRALNHGAALVDRSDRGVLEVRGVDQASWLHNLVTNQVKPLGPGDGVYAFALNVQGRILFDINVLVMRDCTWLDIDRTFLPVAKKHFDKYHIVEDVQVADRGEEFGRIGLAGPGAAELVAELGAPQAAKMPALGVTVVNWRGHELTLVRHDFCGPFGVELFVPAGVAAELRQGVTGSGSGARAKPVGREAVDIRRIEAGIPWPGREITEEYLPAETNQMARAVSHQKGCYLGQEIVERMRARGALARKLSGIRCEGDAVPPAGAQVLDNTGKTVGTVTSACRSLALNRPVALAYLKTAATSPGAAVQVAWEGGIEPATVTELPFVAPAFA